MMKKVKEVKELSPLALTLSPSKAGEGICCAHDKSARARMQMPFTSFTQRG
jgi:hypothetical protein